MCSHPSGLGKNSMTLLLGLIHITYILAKLNLGQKAITGRGAERLPRASFAAIFLLTRTGFFGGRGHEAWRMPAWER